MRRLLSARQWLILGIAVLVIGGGVLVARRLGYLHAAGVLAGDPITCDQATDQWLVVHKDTLDSVTGDVCDEIRVKTREKFAFAHFNGQWRHWLGFSGTLLRHTLEEQKTEKTVVTGTADANGNCSKNVTTTVTKFHYTSVTYSVSVENGIYTFDQDSFLRYLHLAYPDISSSATLAEIANLKGIGWLDNLVMTYIEKFIYSGTGINKFKFDPRKFRDCGSRTTKDNPLVILDPSKCPCKPSGGGGSTSG
ncbi:MAG TPA: hypothetical protein VLE93_00555 [Candidatus Saccharimonadales bacterium]|nr:hypothetical protein [Candidatus Saccharimonadales bacterium]